MMENQEHYYLDQIEKIIYDYRYYKDECSSLQEKISEICLIPTFDLFPQEVYYLIDFLRASLVHLGVLSKKHVLDDSDIDLSGCNKSDLKYMLNSIIDKITNIMYDRETLE